MSLRKDQGSGLNLESIETRRERIDRSIESHAHYLARLDQAVRAFSVTPTGAVTQDQARAVMRPHTQEEKVFVAPLQALITERQPALEAKVQEVRRQLGVTDAQAILGALVVVYNSAIGEPAIFDTLDMPASEPGTRGFYTAQRHGLLGVVAVDTNPAFRKKDGVSAGTSLVHELHHHLCALGQLTQSLDPRLGLATASGHTNHRALVETVKNKPYQSSLDRMIADREALEAIGFTGVAPTYDRSMQQKSGELYDQLAYLDELHSSFLQQKLAWFSPNAALYSSRRKGTHQNLAGTETSARLAAQDLVCLLQGMLALATLHKNMRERTPEERAGLFAKSASAQKFYENFLQEYDEFGAIIGSARTVAQAQRLCLKRWQELLQEDFPRKNLPAFVSYFEKATDFVATSSKGESLSTFLLG